MKPGQIFFATTAYGPETHRVVVVSRESLNQGNTVIVVPFTSKGFDRRKGLRNCVPFLAGTQEGLIENCVARGDWPVTISRAVIDTTAGCLGVVSDEVMRELVRAIGYAMEAECEPE